MTRVVLGIESSCDETAVALVRDGREVLASMVDSQVLEHARYGGVVPELAGRSHLRSIVPLVDRALDHARLALDDVDCIAVTSRPGLIGSLLVGVAAAKALAYTRELPLVCVDHIHAHVYAATMELASDPYPCLALVVSGGHTALYVARSPLELERIATTLDDAAGEAFDKVAHLLGLPYPGGPAISKLASEGDASAYAFPRCRAKKGAVSFSFSGLKTAVLYHLRGQDALAPTPPPERIPDRADVAASFEQAVADSLVGPTLLAASERGLERVLVVGGVACNQRLRTEMRAACAERSIDPVFPSPQYCTDNAAMIAGLGFHLERAGRTAGLEADASAR